MSKIRQFFAILVAVLLAATSAIAQQAFPQVNQVLSNDLFQDIVQGVASGQNKYVSATVLGAFLQRYPLSTMVNPKDFGAYCDGSHHYLANISYINTTYIPSRNTAGWSLAQWQSLYPTLPPGANLQTSDIDGLAISAAFASVVGKAPFYLKVSGKCFASQSINLTGSTQIGVFFDFSGSSITSTAAGVCVLDMSLTAFAVVLYPNVTGDATSEPYCGIRWLRPHPQAVAGDNLMIQPTTAGYFTHSAFENVSTEDNNFIHPIFQNEDLNGGMATVFDGIDFFNAAASEALLANGQPFQTITLVPGTYESMTMNYFVGGRWVCATCSGPIWLQGVRGFGIRNGYMVNNAPTTPKYGTILYMTAGFPNVNVEIQAHYEAYNANMQNIFYVTGTDPTPIIEHFEYQDLSTWPTQSIFGLDNSLVTACCATLSRAHIDVPIFAFFGNVPPPTLFDNGSLWQGSGEADLMIQSNWTLLAAPWAGTVCIAQTTCTTMTPTQPLNMNSDFVSDQPLEHQIALPIVGLTQVADNWVSAINGDATSKASFQDLQGDACNATYYSEQITDATALMVGAGDNIALRTMIQGPDLTGPLWAREGFPGASPFILDFWINSNYTGTVTLFASNYVGQQVITHDVPVTPGCQEYYWQIPVPPTVTGITFKTGYVGLHVGVDLDCGANFQVAPDVWTATAGLSSACTANTSHFLATVGNQVNIGPVRLYSGFYQEPYQPWASAELQTASRQQYQKSVPAGTVPNKTGSYYSNNYQNMGLTGAYTFVAGASGTAFVPISLKLFSSATTAPSVSLFSTGAATGNCYDITAGADGGAASASNISDGGFRLTCAGAISGHEYGVNYSIQGQQ